MSTQSVERPASPSSPDPTPCLHCRLIDDVLSKEGKRTGQVRCLECGAVFEDPYRGLK
ncbi:MAG TPA: hypothetical protein VIR79_07625 [Nitrospira sp.]